jgi:hypothetical protein
VDLIFAGNLKLLPKVCRAYRVLGYGLALAGFKNGYGQPMQKEVFVEMISRCGGEEEG